VAKNQFRTPEGFRIDKFGLAICESTLHHRPLDSECKSSTKGGKIWKRDQKSTFLEKFLDIDYIMSREHYRLAKAMYDIQQSVVKFTIKSLKSFARNKNLSHPIYKYYWQFARNPYLVDIRRFLTDGSTTLAFSNRAASYVKAFFLRNSKIWKREAVLQHLAMEEVRNALSP